MSYKYAIKIKITLYDVLIVFFLSPTRKHFIRYGDVTTDGEEL